jgi:hypothetical protein
VPEAMNPQAAFDNGATDAASVQAAARSNERSVVFWAVLAAGVISIPCLFAGFSGDDLVQRLVLEGRVAGYALSPLQLYDFTPPSFPAEKLIDGGMFPWFASPELSLRFLRPVSSASLWLDHLLFGRNAVLSHLQSWLWVVLLAATGASLYQRWFTRGAALASALVFALSTVHGTPTAWLASRHTLLEAVFALLALSAWVRFREEGRAPFAWLAPAFLSAGLLSSESGLVGVLLLAAYELGTRGLRRGLAGVAGFALLGLVYLVAYVALGYGPKGSSFYVSPFAAPLDYIAIALYSVPALCVELLLGIPSALASFVPAARVPFILAALAAAAALASCSMIFRARLTPLARRSLGWLAAWTFVGLFALVGAPVTGRVLPLPAFGAAAIVGNVIWLVGSGLRKPSSSTASSASPAVFSAAVPASRWWWAALVPLVALHFGLSPLLRIGWAFQFRQMADDQRRLAEHADVGSCATGGSAYLLTGADPALALYAPAALSFYTPSKAGAERWRVLAMVPQRLELGRPAPSVLTLEVLDPPRRDNPFERLYRPADDPLLTGDSVALADLTVRVEQAEAGVFQRASFEFRNDLDAPGSCLLVWRGGRLATLPPPGVGESVTLAHEPGLMGL